MSILYKFHHLIIYYDFQTLSIGFLYKDSKPIAGNDIAITLVVTYVRSRL